MKKIVSSLVIATVLFTMNINAQEQEPKQKKKVRTEKSCSTEEKKSCGSDTKEQGKGKKDGCCSSKKAEKKS
ncbi:hypothetical protein DR871_012755 [Flavobacterium petrolei]|jgi:hypothetical protein|uniref:Secreted protein n=4 Tax=Flavobacterium TaxID=237 RepID=A0A1M5QAS4_9FLAO|nr:MULTISPECIES: hypothetical protein [Flavobacterium]MDD2820003.1 hypothetical protein [Flavobacterium sp.]PRZ22143.1 hypothetical protein BC624_107144 [Flavobacterium granuli]RBN49421.1 hypothetical protein DR980_13325 [Flavobacterium psychrolimnae]RYJ51294.1 hypothetical protein DR871_012755 [Flavobacterium petrolei]TDD77283.1 hypothetical protein E0F89_06760 [Flavobacterium caseinilyticum]